MLSQGPSCRRAISSSKLFTLDAFNTQKQSAGSKQGKRRVSARPFEFATEDTDLDDSEPDSDDDIIVLDDEKDYRPPQGMKKHAKRNVVLSDDEYEDVIIPAAKPQVKWKASVEEMNEGEASTKMQVRIHLHRNILERAYLVLEDDGRANRVEEIQPRPEGIINF
jgi:hypothetical protein